MTGEAPRNDTAVNPKRAVWSDKAFADAAIVQEALDRWLGDSDPLTLAEHIVVALYARGRLS